MGWERDFAVSEVPGTIIGLGELCSMIAFNSTLSIVSRTISRSAKASRAGRRVSRMWPALPWASARMCLISSSISRAVCSLCERSPARSFWDGKEHRTPALAITGPTQTAHAVVHDHAAGDFRGPLQVVLGPRGDVAVDHFFGQGAGQQDLDAAFQLALREQVAVAFGPLHGVAQGGQAAGNDRDLVDGIGVRQTGGNQGVGAFVIGDALLLVGMHHPLPLLQPGRDALDAFGELLHAHRLLAGAGRQERRLVDQIGQVGADEAGSDAGDFPQIDRVVDADLLQRGR